MQTVWMAWTVALALVGSQQAARTQATWVVDANNGAGSHFVSIAAAIANAAPGDRIFVRMGAYQGFRTSKPLTIFSNAGATLTATTIEGLPAGSRFSLAGFMFSPSITVSNCSGLVALSFLTCVRLDRGPSLVIRNSKAVSIHSCALAPGLESYSSEVVLADSVVVGGNPVGPNDNGEPGFYINGGRVDIIGVAVAGGRGSGTGSQGEAVVVQAGALRVLGAKTQLKAGGSGGASVRGASGATVLVLDPRVELVGSVQGFLIRHVVKQSALSVGYGFGGTSRDIGITGREGPTPRRPTSTRSPTLARARRCKPSSTTTRTPPTSTYG